MCRKKRVWSRAVICALPQIGLAALKRCIPAVLARRWSPPTPTRTKIADAASLSERRIIGFSSARSLRVKARWRAWRA